MVANGYALVVSFDPVASPGTLAAFRSNMVSGGVPVYGPYSGKLANDSDSVELYKPDAPQQAPGPDFGFVPYILVDRIQYSDTAPGLPLRTAVGHPWQRVNDALYGNDRVNWTSGSPTAGRSMTQDTDGDGLPDDWEIAHGLDPNSATGLNGANSDPDGDGQTNLEEAPLPLTGGVPRA